tara:strand:+ start:1194 stop:1400 length:207 start_codon:yes stop_codon:yes gene_type:complete
MPGLLSKFKKKKNTGPWSPSGRAERMKAQAYLSSGDESYLPSGVTAAQVNAWNKTRQNKDRVDNSALR